ncbi:glycosyltransferase involved in cell wall biosynthesis [Branchiibius hedensis]|uniref:Glycosyltransferase involved in cell wall bisynthesis n=1 Tax=Branchiibius hedensis TaxID=672460 RepID=A0A2Y8ZRA1_9MICO|nr:glycosyltransferase involved in cell wall biosynthesis [Branchiibius hedensis]SSA34891.1 Glycosyltransferase involved in cell wall bisynthesis [Branchiibius hedensis]
MAFDGLQIAAIVPCYNEEIAVGTVVKDLLAAVPGMTVYVYDNRSSDRTAEVAAAAGAVVRTESRPGKGNVVRRAFADIEADVYLLIDGDDTYDASAAPTMIKTLLSGPYDHVLGTRTDDPEATAYRPGHAAGNRMFNKLIGALFGEQVTDMLSGYRVFSRRFVKSFPALSREFEIETELTVHAVNLRVPQVEVPVGFKDRPDGSESKLRTYHDGFRILRLIGGLLQYERPLALFSAIGSIFVLIAIILGIPLLVTYAQTHEVPRLPTAILATGLVMVGIMSFVIGLILNGILRLRQENARLAYLRLPSVTHSGPTT